MTKENFLEKWQALNKAGYLLLDDMNFVQEGVTHSDEKVREYVWSKIKESSSFETPPEILKIGITDKAELIRLMVWDGFRKTGKMDDEMLLIGAKDDSVNVRQWVWLAAGFFTPTREMIDIGLKDESDAIRHSVWKLGKHQWWYPTNEEYQLGLSDESDFVRSEVLESNGLILDSKIIQNAVFDTSEIVQEKIWERGDWLPTREQIVHGLNSHTAVREAVWRNESWKPLPEDIELGLKAKDVGIQDAIWNRMDWVPSEKQIIDVLSSDSLLSPSLAMERDDWVRTPKIIELGLNGAFGGVVSVADWEPYRHILEAHKLKEKVGLEDSGVSPRAL